MRIGNINLQFDIVWCIEKIQLLSRLWSSTVRLNFLKKNEQKTIQKWYKLGQL